MASVIEIDLLCSLLVQVGGEAGDTDIVPRRCSILIELIFNSRSTACKSKFGNSRKDRICNILGKTPYGSNWRSIRVDRTTRTCKFDNCDRFRVMCGRDYSSSPAQLAHTSYAQASFSLILRYQLLRSFPLFSQLDFLRDILILT